jgi:cell pole-organizing protein PopZ
MSIKDSMPTDTEISQIEEFDKKILDNLRRLIDTEDAVAKSFKDLALNLDRASKEKKAYYEMQREMERQYIQLVGRKSELITQQDLQQIKEHVKRMEGTITNQVEITMVLQEMTDAYKEYLSALKDLNKAWGHLYKNEADWRNTSYEFIKAKEKYDGNKLEKTEKQTVRLKQEVKKAFEEKSHRFSFVEKAMIRVNQIWQKLKVSIKNMAW